MYQEEFITGNYFQERVHQQSNYQQEGVSPETSEEIVEEPGEWMSSPNLTVQPLSLQFTLSQDNLEKDFMVMSDNLEIFIDH